MLPTVQRSKQKRVQKKKHKLVLLSNLIDRKLMTIHEYEIIGLVAMSR